MHPYLNTAVKAARAAGNIITRNMDRMDRVSIDVKNGPGDYVTSIDKAAEAEIIGIIKKAYPEHSILAEESGEQSAENNLNQVVWIIDPIDGTLNFIRGIPQFCVSIGIQVKGVMEHGVIYDPVKNELFTASKGSGAQLDSKRIKVSECKSLENSLLATGLAFGRSKQPLDVSLNRVESILKHAPDLRRLGSAALDLAYVACGRLDGYWEIGLQAWDVAAGALIVREAGGFVGDFQGQDNFMQSGQIVASSPKIFTPLLKLM